jgi:hypothetical protein
VIRLAAVYAVVNLSKNIEQSYLKPALALWEYAEESALYIFGNATGYTVADRIEEALRTKPDRLTYNAIRDLFNRHESSGSIGRALEELENRGRAQRERQKTASRLVERWYAT